MVGRPEKCGACGSLRVAPIITRRRRFRWLGRINAGTNQALDARRWRCASCGALMFDSGHVWEPPSIAPARTTTLLEIRSQDISIHLEAYIDSRGDLVLAGHDLGPRVAQIWPSDEYEYFLTVTKKHLSSVAKALLVQLRRSPRIEAGRGGVERQVVALLKEAFVNGRFKSDVDFREFLDERGIPSEFSSWT